MPTPIAEVEASRMLAHKNLVDPRLWVRLVSRVRQDPEFQEHFGGDPEDMQYQEAERIMNEALGFLRISAAMPGQGFAPSELVDIGWHTFILYTKSYMAFCEKIAGRYIHHEPSDEQGVDYGANAIPKTIAAMQEHGITVDLELWGHGAGCRDYCKNSCSSSSCTDTGRAP